MHRPSEREPQRPALAGLLVLLFVLAAGTACGPAEEPAAPETEQSATDSLDALAPKTTGEDRPIHPLHTVTLCTADLDGTLRFYRDGLGLTARGPIELDEATRAAQRELWQIPAEIGWDLYILERPAADDTIQVRVLLLDRETPLIHASWDSRELGPFSMGFPTLELIPWDEELRAMGYESMLPLTQYQVPRADETMYGIHETIFKAPDFVHAVGISRRDGMPQLGPVDPETGRGGPAYSAQMVENSEEVIGFYTDVLGLELRSDRRFKSGGSKGALGVPDGTYFRFAILYAEGARTKQLLFVDYEGDLALPGPGVPPRPPHRGLAMWTFPVRDLDEMLGRLTEAGIEPVAGPVETTSPTLGHHRALTVLAPNGFLVELFQPLD